jgi:uncharacterized protein
MKTLILPGWLNNGPDHWQSRWEAMYGYERVIQHDWEHPLRGDWITRLEDHLLSNQEHLAQIDIGLEAKNASTLTSTQPAADTVLVAHSLGCHLIAAWAALSRNTHRIRGAFLVAPPDAQAEKLPHALKSWRPPVLQKLPFPSICVISDNDPLCELTSGQAMASAWGSRCVELLGAGHFNPESGLQDWPQGHAWLAQLMS